MLDHLDGLASGGVVPADALTTGPAPVSRKWWLAFRGEVVDDAKARGLSRDALDSGVFTLLAAAAAVPAACFWAAWGTGAASSVVVGAAVLLGWVRGWFPQRETPAGLEAASRWLGVRAELGANDEFARHSALTVALWSRLLAYGAAFGIAPAASRALPLGIESDTRAWSAFGGD